jgi:pilus assembly protein FimV
MNDTTANFRLRVSAWAVASSLALAALPLAAEAAGLGKITVFSALGQPLRAELEVFATREELAGMKAQLASQDAFKQAGVEYAPALSGITLRLDKRANGQPIIRLTSTRPINDPFVDLLLELNWPSGRLIREYTFLLDPPEFAAKNAAAAPAIVRPLAEASPPLEDRPARASSRSRASEQVQKPADGGATYEVKRGETLSKIASELRPEGVSLDQMLLGLFQANQNAFDGGDINRLKAGKILSVPDKATLETIPKGEARTVIVAQSSNWGTYRRKLATVAADAPGREEGARQAAAGKVTTRVEDRGGPAAEPKDQLKVSKTDLPGSKSLPASKRTDEDLIAKEKALRDANERLASLERNVAELQRLVELKSQNLADLERQSAAKAVPATEAKKVPEVAASPTPAAAPPPARVEAAPAAVPAVPAKPLEPPVDVKPVEPVAKPRPSDPSRKPSRLRSKQKCPRLRSRQSRSICRNPRRWFPHRLQRSPVLSKSCSTVRPSWRQGASSSRFSPRTGLPNVVAPAMARRRSRTTVHWRQPWMKTSRPSRFPHYRRANGRYHQFNAANRFQPGRSQAASTPMKWIRLLKLMSTWRTAVTHKRKRFSSRQNRKIPGATPFI